MANEEMMHKSSIRKGRPAYRLCSSSRWRTQRADVINASVIRLFQICLISALSLIWTIIPFLCFSITLRHDALCLGILHPYKSVLPIPPRTPQSHPVRHLI